MARVLVLATTTGYQTRAFGEAAADRVGQQRVMAVARGRQAEQRLQNAMDMRRDRQILTAGHQGDALDRVVDGDREVVARRELLAGEHDIAEQSGLDLPTAFSLDPAERAGQRKGAYRVKPQCIVLSRTQLCGDLFGA